MNRVIPDDRVCQETGSYQCVAIFKAVYRCFKTDDPEVAMEKAIAAEKRGEFDGAKKGLGWRYLHPHEVFVMTHAEENKFLTETLATLRKTAPILRDPERIATEGVLLARELSRAAMRVIREETAKSNRPEVIKAGEDAFAVAKLIANGGGSAA